MSGWFRVARGVFEHPIFLDEPMSEREAWLWLIARAAWKDTQHRVGGDVVPVPRGSLFCTLRELQTAWGWRSDTRVRAFLGRLENERMIQRETNAGKTHVTICNYSRYQVSEREENAGKTHEERTENALKEQGNKKEDISSLRSDSESDEKPFPKAKKEPSRFDEFWSIYPKRDGSNPKEPARQKFDLACKRGADPQAIISAAQRYAEQQKRLGNIGSPYVKQAVSWLNAQSWKDDYGSASASASDDYAKQREFLARLPASQLIGYVQQFYQKRFVWKVDLMGPPPSSPDTLVPPEMINEAKEGIQHEQMGSQSVARGGIPVSRIYNVA
jgi:hypothetical protein